MAFCRATAYRGFDASGKMVWWCYDPACDCRFQAQRTFDVNGKEIWYAYHPTHDCRVTGRRTFDAAGKMVVQFEIPDTCAIELVPSNPCEVCADGTPKYASVTFAGVSLCPGVSCDLDQFNTTHILTYSPGCIWRVVYPVGTICTDADLEIRIYIMRDGTCVITAYHPTGWDRIFSGASASGGVPINCIGLSDTVYNTVSCAADDGEGGIASYVIGV